MAMIDSRIEIGIAVLEINRPPVNSYTTELLKELDAAILDARFNDDIHAIIITGKVEKFFSAGADINMLSSKSLGFKNNFALHGHEVLMRLENTPKIIIAAINGHAVGGGLEIAMACDIRIAKKEGGKVGLAEINLGVMPGMLMMPLLTQPENSRSRAALAASAPGTAASRLVRSMYRLARRSPV